MTFGFKVYNNITMQLVPEKKKEIEQMLVETIITSLEEKKLTADEYRQVSSFILDNMKNITTQEQLAQFLNDLSAKWQIFSKIMTLYAGEEKEAKEEEATQNVVELAKSGKIEDAITLAKTVTGGTK